MKAFRTRTEARGAKGGQVRSDARGRRGVHGGPGLSRRQMLGRAGGGLAGALLAWLGLASGRSEGRTQASFISLRAVLRQISLGCHPENGIRQMLPDRPVISLLDFIRRFYHG